MTLLVLVILAVIWAAVLVPPYLQSRSDSRPADSISSFQKQLSILERRAYSAEPAVPGRPLTPRYATGPLPMSRSEIKKRRRDIFFTLAAAAGLTLMMALVFGGMVWGLNLLCDALLGGYVYLLVQMQQHATERNVKVRYLPERTPRRQVEPQFLLRRSGS